MNTTSTVPSVTLKEAIVLQVKEFATNNESFSVYDITRSIRGKAYNGALEIPEVEVAGASFRFDIPHSTVKAIFIDLFQNNSFEPAITVTRNFTGMYFQYSATVNQPATNGGTTVSTTAAPSVVTPPSPTASSPKLPNNSNVRDRIKLYLTNCANRGFNPTIKQVQSAIKRSNVSTGWSRSDIARVIDVELGLGSQINKA